jgi:hypothetical protein
MLSEWWSGGPCDDDLFWRTAGSGGKATRRTACGKKTSANHGDITATDERGAPLIRLLYVETKRGYGSSSLQDLLDKPAHRKNAYREWIAKCEAGAKASGAPWWLLVVRRDQRRAVAVMPESLLVELCPGEARQMTKLTWFETSGKQLVAVSLEDFFAAAGPEAVRAAVRRYGLDELGRTQAPA